jgi:hypothetical protein
MQQKLTNFIIRNEALFPAFVFLLFLAVAIPGVNWGVPALWNPDELVWRVDSALHGEMIFDETEPDFNYPSLPKYVMYGVGEVVYGMGYSSSEFIIAARLVSALLGALTGVLVYYLARTIGANALTSLLAGLLYISSGIAAANGRFAHNDLYLQFFSILCIYFAIKYQFTKARLWIYSSFFAVGLAASSKYTGGSLLLLPLFVLIVMNWSDLRKNKLQSIETLLIGGALSFGGFVSGTPKALLWMAFYFKRVIPALQRFALYGKNSGVPIGLYGQWAVFESAVGTFAYYLFILGFIWFAIRLILWRFGKIKLDGRQAQAVIILVAAVLIFDLPFTVSVNYVARFFIPFVPFLSILGAFFVKDMVDLAKSKSWNFVPPILISLLAVGIVYSMLRLVGTALLFMNDARMPASEFISKLPGEDKVIEYTLYPPIVNKQQFYKAHNYPIFFLKYPNEVMPTGGRFEYNQGEQGLIEREVDYLVIDTFTYSRFSNDLICETNPVECDFFKKLLAGEVTSFRLIKEFTYSLPPYLPDVSVLTVNPEVRIYQRVR